MKVWKLVQEKCDLKPRILLVDDDPTLLQFLKEFMGDHGFDVSAASSGPEGLKIAFRERPDLVVLDVMMPGMDGWEVTARLREMSNLPIILLTAKSAEADKLRGFRLGVDDYVLKPFSFAELIARIQAVLNRANRSAVAGEHQLILFGDVVVDLDKREASRNGESLNLTPTEFRLLECLGQRQGKAVSEADLIQEVWGAYRSEDTTSVRRYIWLLRQKVELDPSNPRWIQTVRGFGYRLELDADPAE